MTQVLRAGLEPVAVPASGRAMQAVTRGVLAEARVGAAPSVSCVLPCFNEAESLASLLPLLATTLSACTPAWEVVLVDDGSRDETPALLAGWARRPGFRVLQLSRNFGKEAALSAGLAAAHGDVVVLMDADGQHEPALIRSFLEQWRAGADVVYAVRQDRRDESRFKRWGTRAFYSLLNATRRFEVPAGGGDFRLLDRAVVDTLLRLPGTQPIHEGPVRLGGLRGRGRALHAGAAPPRPQPLQPAAAHPSVARRADLVHHAAAARGELRRLCTRAAGLRLRRRHHPGLPAQRPPHQRLDDHRREPDAVLGHPAHLRWASSANTSAASSKRSRRGRCSSSSTNSAPGWPSARRERCGTGARPAALGRCRQDLARGRTAGAVLVATAGLRPLLLPDEGRYAGVAWEMLRSGDWLTPTLNGLPFFHKPPLFYWLTAGSLALFGPHEAAARVAPLLGAWGGGLALFLFLRRWCGAPRARTALAVMAVQPLVFVGAQFANLDMLVAGCITATVLSLAHAVLCLEAGLPHRRALLAAYALAALGVLAKGLIGFVIPALVGLAWLLVRGRWRLVPRLLSLPGLALFLLLAAPWFVAMQLHHPGFLHYFFVVQHVQRFAAGGFNNVQPFWFYPAVLALCTLPWLPWLRPLARQATEPGDAVRSLMVAWLAVVVVFFSLPASKLVGYVLPALPPLAALLAEGVALAQVRWRRRALGASAAVSVLAGLGVVVGLAFWPPHTQRELGTALAAQIGAGEPVFALLPYPYDLPYYARLRQPLVVVDRWGQGKVQQRDDWHQELADAARFAPALAARTLVETEALPALLCATPLSWVITPARAARAPSWLAAAERVYSGHDATLWRLRLSEPAVAAGLGCAQTPSAGLPSR